jgi:hypothetical protein
MLLQPTRKKQKPCFIQQGWMHLTGARHSCMLSTPRTSSHLLRTWAKCLHIWTGHQYTQYTTTHLHPFGSTAYVDVISRNGHGVLEAASVRCWLLGWWVDRSRGYRLEDPRMHTLIMSRDTQFVETSVLDTLRAVKGKYTTTTSGLTVVPIDDAPAHVSDSLPPGPTALAPSISVTKVHLGSNLPPALLGIQHTLSKWIGASAPTPSEHDATADNLNTTQTPECTKEKYNAKIKMKGSLLRSHQQPM